MCLGHLPDFEPVTRARAGASSPELFSALAIRADLDLTNVEAADRARIDPHAADAVRRLESALEEHKQNHVEAAAKQAAEALHRLELAHPLSRSERQGGFRRGLRWKAAFEFDCIAIRARQISHIGFQPDGRLPAPRIVRLDRQRQSSGGMSNERIRLWSGGRLVFIQMS